MNAMRQTGMFSPCGKSSLVPRAVVLAVVTSAHFAVAFAWSAQADTKFVTINELSLSFSTVAKAPQPVIAQPLKTLPVPLPVQPAQPLQPEATQAPAAVATPGPAPATTVVAATEPDYKASYLNNPPPAYPMVARRNGLQGRVVLSVEVLAGGVCGQINIHKSSGYSMLDDAALQTVKHWRFLPASQAGRAVDKWFMIPIQFSLKDNTA